MSVQYGPAAGGEMSHGGYAPAVAPSRPGTLVTAFWLSIVAGILAIVGGITMIAGGRASIQAFLEKTLFDTVGAGVDPGLIDATIGDELDAAYQTLVTKAVVGIVLGVIVAAFALLARSGGNAGRVLLTVALAAGWCGVSGLQLGEADVLPTLSIAAAGLVPLLSLVSIILLYLPPTNRYFKARKAAAVA